MRPAPLAAVLLAVAAPAASDMAPAADLYAVQTAVYNVDTGPPLSCFWCLWVPGPALATYGKEDQPPGVLPPGEHYFAAALQEDCSIDVRPAVRLTPAGGAWTAPVFVDRTYPVVELPPSLEDHTGSAAPILLHSECAGQAVLTWDLLVLPLGTMTQGFTADLAVAFEAGGTATDVDVFPSLG